MNLPARIEQFIAANPFALYDKHSIAFAMECHTKTAAKMLAAIHDGGKLLVIDHWIRSGGDPQPVYRNAVMRPGQDAPRPGPLPADVKRAARRARQEVRDAEAHKKRADRSGGVVRLGMFGV